MEGFPKPFLFVSHSHLVKSPEKAYAKKKTTLNVVVKIILINKNNSEGLWMNPPQVTFDLNF